MSWILFSILTALFWASGNIIDKFVFTRWVVRPIIPVIIGGIIGLLASLIIYLTQGFVGLSGINTLNFTFNKAFWFMVLASGAIAANAVITKYLLNFADCWTIFSYTRGIGVIVALLPVIYLNFNNLIGEVKKNGKKAIGMMTVSETLNVSGGLFIRGVA